MLIVWCIAGLAGWWWLLRRTPGYLGGEAPAGRWHAGDAVFAAAIALLICAGIVGDEGKEIAVTQESLRSGVVFYLTVIVLFSSVAFARGQTPQEAFGLAPARPGRALGLGIFCIALTLPWVQAAEGLVSFCGYSASDGDVTVKFLRGKLTTSDIVWTSVLAVIVAPLTEELVFRGYLYGVIKKYGGRGAGLFTNALLFAAMHNNLPALPALTILALGLTLAYEITGSLWTSIVMHMIFNLVPLVLILRFPEWIPKS